MRILQLQTSNDISPALLAEQIVHAVHEAGMSIDNAYLKGEAVAQKKTAADPEIFLGRNGRDATKGLRLGLLLALRKRCRENQVDVFIAHRFKPIYLLLLLNRLTRLRAGIAVVHGIGDFDRRFRRWLVRLLIADNCRFVAVSEPVRNYLIGLDCGLHAGNVITINNAIDIDAIRATMLPRDEARSALGIAAKTAPARLVVGTIGRLVPVKDHLTLLKATALLRDRGMPIHTVIIGGGRLQTELQQFIDDHALQDCVTLAGEREQAVRYVRAFDVFALTSLSEGLPLALLEGMAGELPVIGSDIPSIRGVVEKVGQLFPVGNAEALAGCIAQFAGMSAEALEQEGKKHLQHVREHHALADFRQRYVELINTMTDDRSPR